MLTQSSLRLATHPGSGPDARDRTVGPPLPAPQGTQRGEGVVLGGQVISAETRGVSEEGERKTIIVLFVFFVASRAVLKLFFHVKNMPPIAN